MLSAEPPLAVSRSWAQYQRDQGQATLGSDQGRSLDSVFPVYGGDDGARIRDLCRDRNNRYVFQHLTMHRDWLSTRKSWKTASSVGWTVG